MTGFLGCSHLLVSLTWDVLLFLEWGCLIITGVVLLSCLWEVIVAFGVLLLVLLIVIPFYISAVNKFCQAVTAYIGITYFHCLICFTYDA